MSRIMGVLALLLAVAGCSGDGEIDYAVVSGELIWPEPIALPAGAQAHLMIRRGEAPVLPLAEPVMRTALYGAPWLRDPSAMDRGDAVLARDMLDVGGAQPVPFSLRYDRAAAEPGGALLIEAWITAGEQVLFAVTVPPRVAAGSAARAQVMLRRPAHVAFACDDGSRPAAAVPAMGGLAFLEADGGRPVSLRAEPTAAGFRYSGEGYSLRGRGDEAVLQRPSRAATRCTAAKP